MGQIIVGNSPLLLNHDYGEFIDSFDTVVRLNGYKIKGFEKYVGAKTDIWACNGFTFGGYAQIDTPPTDMILNNRPGRRNKVQRQAKRANVKYEEIPEMPEISELPLRATTGIRVIFFLLKYWKWEKPTIIGFEGFRRAPHHYWKALEGTVPRPPRNRKTKWGNTHRPYLQQLHDDGIIKWIQLLKDSDTM